MNYLCMLYVYYVLVLYNYDYIPYSHVRVNHNFSFLSLSHDSTLRIRPSCSPAERLTLDPSLLGWTCFSQRHSHQLHSTTRGTGDSRRIAILSGVQCRWAAAIHGLPVLCAGLYGCRMRGEPSSRHHDFGRW